MCCALQAALNEERAGRKALASQLEAAQEAARTLEARATEATAQAALASSASEAQAQLAALDKKHNELQVGGSCVLAPGRAAALHPARALAHIARKRSSVALDHNR